ncbi:hypothetical protein WS67_19280 [Burkholderia singularis]|uniref:JmjC domain-containing protein n=1 Tax=Burkholderia singularis TaxID=1503053 RepID=A0A103DYM1_9BURK|nr:cupin domain-containing protein [Burkholderia singularis]KVE25128.1 hypothetical protein WS67_19280 [Burkholderia singularis]
MFFETVLSGVSREVFIRDTMGKRHQHYKDSHSLHQSVSVRDIDDLLTAWNGQLETFVLVSMNGNVVHFPRSESHQINQKSQIEQLYRQGATLTIDGFHMRHPLFSQLCRDLEDQIGGSTTTKAFITPPGRPGYNVHFDALDTFVLQLEGTKHWKVFPQFVSMPTATQARELDDEETGEPLAEYLMQPGDLLYMPAGYPHCARCTNEHSTHITIGFAPWRVNHIAEFILSTLLAPTSEAMRHHILAPEIDDKAEATLKVGLMNIASALERIDPKVALNTFQSAARGIMPRIRDYGIKSASMQPLLTERSMFIFNAFSLHRLEVDPEAEIAYVRLGCSVPPRLDTLTLPPHIELPAYAAPDLDWIFKSRVPFSASDVRGDLDLESRLVLINELITHGVVNVVAA